MESPPVKIATTETYFAERDRKREEARQEPQLRGPQALLKLPPQTGDSSTAALGYQWRRRAMVAGLILAAGESSRMGRDKALLTYHSRTFLETILATLRESGVAHIATVLGHHADEIRRAVDLAGATVVINQAYRRGQTSSLQAGIEALENPELEAIVLTLVDHPAISAEVVQRLVSAFRQSGSPVVIPTYRGQRGHPVLIGRSLFEELKNLDSGEGANTVLRKYRDATQLVEVQDAGILLDVDDPETYRRLREGEEDKV